MQLDPEVAAALDRNAREQRMVSLDERPESLAAMRQQRERAAELWNTSLDRSGVVTSEHSVPGPPGAPDVYMRVHRPADPLPDLLPCYFHVHGGGQVAGNPYTDDGLLVPLVRAVDCVAISIEYRLAPETTAPGAAEDAYAALTWVVEHAVELGVDRTRIVLAGTSGGGGIAAATALMARDRGGPPLRLQMLIGPMLDDRGITPSSTAPDWLVWSADTNRHAWRAVLGSRFGTDEVTPHQSPARAIDLAGLPPTYVEVGDMEVFRDECIDYVTRLLRAGVNAELHVYPGSAHGFDILAADAAVSRTALAVRYAPQRAFRPAQPPPG